MSCSPDIGDILWSVETSMSTEPRPSILIRLLSLYTVASLVHFAHNAAFLNDYPNLPSSLTRSGVYLAWVGLACIGGVGFLLYRYCWRFVGLMLLGLYAALGLDGLLHYTRAPVGRLFSGESRRTPKHLLRR